MRSLNNLVFDYKYKVYYKMPGMYATGAGVASLDTMVWPMASSMYPVKKGLVVVLRPFTPP
jgi:hypothetical protein